jgi:hypothetical protein
MTSSPRINLDKLVRRIVLDICLLRWFATTGGRKVAALERHVTEGGTNAEAPSFEDSPASALARFEHAKALIRGPDS